MNRRELTICCPLYMTGLESRNRSNGPRTVFNSEAIAPESLERDPENLLYARGPRMRVSAEVVRDNALAIGGLLVMKIGGPPVKPYQPEGLWLELAGGAGQGAYERGSGDEIYRRSLYTYRKRTVPHPTMSTFDAPSWEICRVMRSRTNTPLQALALLNDTTYVEAARGLAERMLLEAGPEVEEQLEYGFRLATGRIPTKRELGILKEGYVGYLDVYREEPDAAAELLAHGDSPANADLDRSTLAACTAVATVILNLDETITKE